MLNFKAQSQSLREVRVKPATDKSRFRYMEASGGGGGVDSHCARLPQPRVSGRGLLKPALLQLSCIGPASVLRQLLETVGQAYFRWLRLRGEAGESSLAELLSPSGQLSPMPWGCDPKGTWNMLGTDKTIPGVWGETAEVQAGQTKRSFLLSGATGGAVAS